MSIESDGMHKKLELRLFAENDQETGVLLAVYFQIRKGHAARVLELANGAAFANYDRKGRLLGIEMLAPCEIQVLDQIARKEPAEFKNRIKKFLRESMPKKMARA